MDKEDILFYTIAFIWFAIVVVSTLGLILPYYLATKSRHINIENKHRVLYWLLLAILVNGSVWMTAFGWKLENLSSCGGLAILLIAVSWVWGLGKEWNKNGEKKLKAG